MNRRLIIALPVAVLPWYHHLLPHLLERYQRLSPPLLIEEGVMTG